MEAVLLAGKSIVYVDVEADGFNATAEEIAPLLDSDCIVIATHQFGIPCEIEMISRFCKETGAFLVEDVAAALGTRVNGRLVGTWGDAAFFSFDSTKLLNVPLKAGFLHVRDSQLFAHVKNSYERESGRIKFGHKLMLLIQASVLLVLENRILYRLFHTVMFSWRGRFTTDRPELSLSFTVFYTNQMSEWQAFFANQQIQKLDALITRRRQMYVRLRNGLAHCSKFILPPNDEHLEWACIRFPVRVHGDKIEYYRRAALAGVDCAFSFTFIECPEHMTFAKRLAASVLDLPFYVKLTDDEVDETIRIFCELEQ